MQPLVQRLRVEDSYYVYDSNTNEIIQVDKIIWDILEFYGDKSDSEITKKFFNVYPEEEIIKAINSIRKANIKTGLFSDRRPVEIRPLFIRETLQEKLNKDVSHIILGVTEECNFRCEYCTFSGHYAKERTHSSARMDVQTALKAVDFIYAHYIPDNKKSEHLTPDNKKMDPSIGFYGGEPILEFPLIKKVVEYTKKKFDIPVFLGITTNGSLLNHEVIKFLIDNKFAVTVSLDGPEEIHDRYRKFIDKSPTYRVIYKNLKRFREMNEDFFIQNVSIQMQICPSFDYERLHEYLSNDTVLQGVNINLSSISNEENTFFDRFSKEDLCPKGLDKLNKKFKDALIEKGKCDDWFLKALFEKPLVNIQKRKLFKRFNKFHPPQGICMPGVRRVFVRPNGDLLTCERVNQSMVIGHIDRGYDLNKIFKIIENYTSLLTEICPNCWAIRLCQTCFANNHFTSEGYNIEFKKRLCEVIKEALLKQIIEYCTILRRNPHAFDYMKDIFIL